MLITDHSFSWGTVTAFAHRRSRGRLFFVLDRLLDSIGFDLDGLGLGLFLGRILLVVIVDSIVDRNYASTLLLPFAHSRANGICIVDAQRLANIQRLCRGGFGSASTFHRPVRRRRRWHRYLL
jgi:hypothetical protein